MSTAKATLLAVVLSTAGCGRDKPEAGDPAAPQVADPFKQEAEAPPAAVALPAEAFSPPAPVLGAKPAELPPAPIKPSELKVGMDIFVVARMLGDCLYRPYYMAPGPQNKAGHIFEAKPGECRKKFPAEHYWLTDGKVTAIKRGYYPEAPRTPEKVRDNAMFMN
jgi:hypothetical protein